MTKPKQRPQPEPTSALEYVLLAQQFARQAQEATSKAAALIELKDTLKTAYVRSALANVNSTVGWLEYLRQQLTQ